MSTTAGSASIICFMASKMVKSSNLSMHGIEVHDKKHNDVYPHHSILFDDNVHYVNVMLWK